MLAISNAGREMLPTLQASRSLLLERTAGLEAGLPFPPTKQLCQGRP